MNVSGVAIIGMIPTARRKNPQVVVAKMFSCVPEENDIVCILKFTTFGEVCNRDPY